MPARKRNFGEVDSSVIAAPTEPSLLHKIRNCWEFAALMQYIFFFGQAVKIDQNLDIDELEAECMKHNSEKLSEIGLALLKYVSSHKGLTPDIFDEYTRRQYLVKAPGRNPFGVDEEPLHFADFDVFTKLRVLYQLSVWTLGNPDRIRAQMEEKESEQTQWRIEPLGWDKDEHAYIVLDDDRLYRKTDPLPPPEPAPKPKAKSKPKTRKGRRQSKRIKITQEDDTEIDETEVDGDETEVKEEENPAEAEDNGLGGAKWACIAVTHEEYKAFLDNIQKSKDPDEKALHKRITLEVLPVIEKRAEAQERKAAARRRELENLEKLATAKRSSRIASRVQQQRDVQEAEDAERKRKADLEMAHREQEKQEKLEHARESRMQTREQRLKDREVKRILHEEELTRLRESSENSDASGGRVSERHRQAELERRERALQQMNEEDDENWYFDCSVCGLHGQNLDDGTHSMACEKCNVWQHSACHGITPTQAEDEDFHFVCASCRRTGLKLRLNQSASPEDKNKQVVVSNGHQLKAEIAAPPPYQQQSNGFHQDDQQRLPHPAQPVNTTTSAHSQEPSLKAAPQNGMTDGDLSRPNELQAVQPTADQPEAINTFAKPAATTGNIQQFTNNQASNGLPPFSSPAPRPFPQPSVAMTPNTSFALSGNSVAATPLNSFQPAFQQTPASASRPHLATASFANSPTPSLSATQGATDFHFSPAPPPPSHPAKDATAYQTEDEASHELFTFSPDAAFPTSSYIPTTTAPTVSALSPIKHDPPRSESPMLPAPPAVMHSIEAMSPRPTSRGHRQSGIGLPDDVPVPDLRSSPEIDESFAGRSPVKHDLPPSSPMMEADAEEMGKEGDVSMLDP